MVTTFYPPYSFGGDGIFVQRLAQGLAERGHRVDVVHNEDAFRIASDADPGQGFADHPNVSRRPLHSRWPRLGALGAHQLGAPAGYGPRLRALIEGGSYDVIHYHNVSLVGGPGVLRTGSAVKLYTPHEYWLICPTHVLFRFDREACTRRTCLACVLHARRPPQLWRRGAHLRRCVAHVDRFLMLSRFALERHRAEGIDAPMTVLPGFVPEPPPRASADPVWTRPFFLFVGRLEKLKGLQDVVPLFRDLPGADLLVVGEGSWRPRLEQLARGIANVRFVGALPPERLDAYYRQALAVVIPSLCYEVFPLIAAEAASHGTPVLARRIGALAEVVEEGGGGLTFTSPHECRQALLRLQAEPELRRRLGRRGRETARTKWTRDAHLDRYLAIIEELREKRAARPER